MKVCFISYWVENKEEGETRDSNSFLESKNQGLRASMFMGTRVYDSLVSSVLIGGTFSGDTITCASWIACSSS